MASKTLRSSPADLVAFLAGPGGGALTQFLARQRWFAAKARGIHAVGVEDWAVLEPDRPLLLLLLSVDGERYYVPLSVSREPETEAAEPVARLGRQTIIDAHADGAFGREVLAAFAEGRALAGRAGHFRFRPTQPWAGTSGDELESLGMRRLSGEQSNTSIVFGRALILKSLRRPQSGINPDLEITRFLTTRTSFAHVPRLAGWIEYVDKTGETTTVGLLQRFIANAGDGWRHTLAALHSLCDSLERSPSVGPEALAARSLAEDMRQLGAVTGGLHAALACDPSLAAFRPEPVTREDTRHWALGIADNFEQLAADIAALPGGHAGNRAILESLASVGPHVGRVIGDLDLLADCRAHKIRCHGDYHLGQVLKTADSFVVIDFEGEPARSLTARRTKHSPLRDLAGMLRSFNYAVESVLADRPARERPQARAWLERWEGRAREVFVDGFVTVLAGSPVRLVPSSREDLRRVGAVFELEKACYELRYELNNRPDWVSIPLAGISAILGVRAGGC